MGLHEDFSLFQVLMLTAAVGSILLMVAGGLLNNNTLVAYGAVGMIGTLGLCFVSLWRA